MVKPVKKQPNLTEDIGRFFADPLGFVLYAYPWGVEGTELAKEDGPDEWQRELLERVGKSVLDDPEGSVKEAVASGHGVGKSALLCWVIQWVMSTRPNCRITVTANTETQLDTKTWAELSKWHKLLINKSWFEWTATSFKHRLHPETWFASAIPWSENRPEAFAGQHARYSVMIFDEASAIPDIIWDNAEGATTTPGSMWFVFGNMTRAVGRFVQCFEKFRHRWNTTHVDSRKAKKANQKQIKEWIEDYGEDSDFVRIRVRGVKPRSGSTQFISHETVANCHTYRAWDYERFAKVSAVDVARSGACESVMTHRQGRKVFPQVKWRERDSMKLAGFIAEQLRRERPQVCFIEGNGLGGPIIDRLRQLGWGDVVIEVNPGETLRTGDCLNHRAQWWRDMRTAMEGGIELPEDPELDEQLTMVEYDFNKKTLQLQIQDKSEMEYSPDRADSLMLTFVQGGVVVAAKDMMPMEALPVLGCA